ncbi:MAG TPA: hypothetical protein VHV57_07885 [Acidimicrobiales bacterium]|jgi:hypothetical protein|nr:hypothetical protein [Acidimicrobiales bacterium]
MAPSLGGLKLFDEPPGPDHDGTKGLSPLAQTAIGGDQRDGSGGVGDDFNEHVVPIADGVNDFQAIRGTRLDPVAGLSLQNDNNSP